MNDNTLDPKNWDEIRALGHKMMDDMMDYLSTVRDRPVWQAIPDDTKDFFEEPLPQESKDASLVYNEFTQHIQPYAKGSIHPRFWAWVEGTGTPLGALADFLASSINSNVAIGEQAAMYVDQQVVNWSIQLMGMPDTSSGILVSGGSMANATALIVARNSKIDDVRSTGLQGLKRRPVMYCSTETHSCVIKSAEVIGIGSHGLRRIPVNADFQIDIALLEKKIIEDLDLGYQPLCVIANAGTVNTGAIDDLMAIRGLTSKYDLWMHVDGAFGALAVLSPDHKEVKEAIALTDSVAFDYHKWMYMPYEVGCVLINDKKAHTEAFNLTPNYLLKHERGLASGPESLNSFGIELSRGFKALKVWMSIKEHGMQAYADMINKNIAQANYLGNLVMDNDDLELATPVTLNVVCYRYMWSGMGDEVHNERNKEITMRLQEEGIASPSSTVLDGKYYIRVAITNHRSIKSDFDLLINETIRIARALS
jgi:aromatic-L-amino-acid decarboxylase